MAPSQSFSLSLSPWTSNHFERISLDIGGAGLSSNRLKGGTVAYAFQHGFTCWPCVKVHVQCTYSRYTRTCEGISGRKEEAGRGEGGKPLNGVTPRQSHHLGIVWAKPSKSTANRLLPPPLLLSSCPRSSFAPLLSRRAARPSFG